MTTLSIELDDETAARLSAIAETRQERTESLVAEVLKAFADTDQARWEEYERTGNFVSNADAVEWLTALERGENHPCPK